jgi:hypothetical protein
MPPDEYSRTVLGAVGDQSFTERDISLATEDAALSDASSASPELLYGHDKWKEMREFDPDGVVSVAKFEFDWNFGMTPVDRAKAVWTSNLHDGGKAVLDGINNSVYEASKVRDASHVDAIRRRRSGFGGAM